MEPQQLDYFANQGFYVIDHDSERTSLTAVLVHQLEYGTDELFINELVEHIISCAFDREFYKLHNYNSTVDVMDEAEKIKSREDVNEDFVLLSTATMKNVNIFVHETSGKLSKYPDDAQYGKALYIARVNDRHYYSLRKLSLDEKFWQDLEQRGFKLKKIKGDGHCLYRCIANGTKMLDPWIIRLHVAVFILENYHDEAILNHFIDCNDDNDEYKRRVKSIEKDQDFWGDALSIVAAAKFYKINIHVYYPPPTKTLCYNYGTTNGPIISVYYNGADHYHQLLNNGHPSVDAPLFSKGSSTTFLLPVPETYYVYIVINQKTDITTLSEALKSTHVNRMDIMIDYRKELRGRFENSEVIQELATVFRGNFSVPQNLDAVSRCWSLCQLMIVPVLLVSLHVQWKGLKIGFQLDMSDNGLTSLLMLNLWKLMNEELKKEVEHAFSNPDSIMCELCNLNCGYRSKVWHHDLSKFKKIQLSKSSDTEYLSSPNNYDFEFGEEIGRSHVFAPLKENHDAKSQDVTRLFDAITAVLK